MADIDIDPFGEHESRPEEPTDEHIPLDLRNNPQPNVVFAEPDLRSGSLLPRYPT